MCVYFSYVCRAKKVDENKNEKKETKNIIKKCDELIASCFMIDILMYLNVNL